MKIKVELNVENSRYIRPPDYEAEVPDERLSTLEMPPEQWAFNQYVYFCYDNGYKPAPLANDLKYTLGDGTVIDNDDRFV